MNEGFELPVDYNGSALTLSAKLLQFGYSYKIEVDAYGTIIFFEKDEERNWRAVLSDTDLHKRNAVDRNLVASIIQALESHF